MAENHPQRGIYIFKKGFNGDIIELVDEMYIVYNPLVNAIFNMMQYTYKAITGVKEKIKRKEYREKTCKNKK